MLASRVVLWKPPHDVWSASRYFSPDVRKMWKSYHRALYRNPHHKFSPFNHPIHPNPFTLDNVWGGVKRFCIDFLWKFALGTSTSLCRQPPPFYWKFHLWPFGWRVLLLFWHVLMLLTVIAQCILRCEHRSTDWLSAVRMWTPRRQTQRSAYCHLSCLWHSEVWTEAGNEVTCLI